MLNRFLNQPSRRLTASLVALLCLTAGPSSGQTLNLPARANDALSGSLFTNLVAHASRDDRENWIYAQVAGGNVPGWLRTLKSINTSIAGHTGTFHVTPDYLAVGSDQDYFLTPCTPILAQRLATRLGCSLTTRRMENLIWAAAEVRLNDQTIGPSPAMTTVPVFAWHNYMVRTQRNAFTNSNPLGALVSGDKKDVVISTKIYTNFDIASITKPVVIYGWHRLSQGGAVWQQLYNGHEETYADYSHGIRLVQSNLTVDGTAESVSAVLQSPTLNGLLSDEGVIPLPYYSVAPYPPKVLIHPRSQTVLAGQSIMLQTLAAGDPSLTYRWVSNGTILSATTNTSFLANNLGTANAGNYSVIVSNAAGSVTSRVATVRVRTNTLPLLFRDDFETNSAVLWDLIWASTNGTPDYTANWAYDYGASPYFFNGLISPIPPAPNSATGSTRALRLTVNNNDATSATAAVNLYPKAGNFSGNFSLKFDLWINYPGIAGGINSTGSTQHALFGLNHLGTNANWAPVTATASDGFWFAVDGEGGIATDYRAYKGNLAGTQIDLTASLGASDSSAAIYQNLFPAGRFESAGAPGKRWVEVELRQTNNIVHWLMDGTAISSRTNDAAFTSGRIMIGLMDVFPSIANPARDAFVLFDNVRVENLSPPPIRFETISRLANGAISLSLTSAPNDTFWLDVSTNLNSWQLLAILTTSNGSATMVDSDAPALGARYYRARR